LEDSARADDRKWSATLREVLPGIGEALPDWATELRAFLAAGPEIGLVVAHLI
jgi:hypothetical protein